MGLKDYLSIFIPSLITILGFIITSINNKKEFNQSIQKYKTEHQISDLYGLQKDAIECSYALCRLISSPEGDYTEIKRLQNKINLTVICFGSDDAVKIMLYIKRMVFSGVDDGASVSNRVLIAAYVLLAMQLKYDTTGIKTSPEVWYIGMFTSNKMLSSGFYEDSVIAVNQIVDEIGLNHFLKIKP